MLNLNLNLAGLQTTKMKITKNTTINSDLYTQCALKIMSHRHFDDYSEFVSTLVREEWDRRAAAILAAIPPTDQPSSSKGRQSKAVGIVKRHHRRRTTGSLEPTA